MYNLTCPSSIRVIIIFSTYPATYPVKISIFKVVEWIFYLECWYVCIEIASKEKMTNKSYRFNMRMEREWKICAVGNETININDSRNL